MTIPIYIIRLVSISNTLKSCQVPALSRNLTTYLTNSYLQFGLGSEVGLDVEVSKEEKEDESVAEHVVGERQGESAVVIENLKQKYK